MFKPMLFKPMIFKFCARPISLALALLVGVLAHAPLSYAAERFSGQGNLAASQSQTSANQRFAIRAELQAAPAVSQTSTNGRFSIVADLTAPKSALGTCGPLTEVIFKNGFEN